MYALKFDTILVKDTYKMAVTIVFFFTWLYIEIMDTKQN